MMTAKPKGLFSSIRQNRSLHCASLRSAPVGMTESLFGYAPQHRKSSIGHDAVDPVGAEGERLVPLAERQEHHVFHRAGLQLLGDLLALVLAGRHAEGVAQLFDLG